MIGLLIITHHTLGAAYTQLAQHFFPEHDLSHVQILNVGNHDDHTDIIKRVSRKLPEIPTRNGVLILTDIFGATPCNAALKLIEPQRSAMVTGLNAPMLIKAINHAAQYDNLAEFARMVQQAGLNGIMVFTDNAPL